jgi:hypothetical protein
MTQNLPALLNYAQKDKDNSKSQKNTTESNFWTLQTRFSAINLKPTVNKKDMTPIVRPTYQLNNTLVYYLALFRTTPFPHS